MVLQANSVKRFSDAIESIVPEHSSLLRVPARELGATALGDDGDAFCASRDGTGADNPTHPPPTDHQEQAAGIPDHRDPHEEDVVVRQWAALGGAGEPGSPAA